MDSQHIGRNKLAVPPMAGSNRGWEDDIRDSISGRSHHPTGSARRQESPGLVRASEPSPVQVYLAGGHAFTSFGVPAWGDPPRSASLLSCLPQDGLRPLASTQPAHRASPDYQGGCGPEAQRSGDSGICPVWRQAEVQAAGPQAQEDRPILKLLASIVIGAALIVAAFWVLEISQ